VFNFKGIEMDPKVLFKGTLLIMLLIVTLSLKTFADNPEYFLYGGLGNLVPSEKVTPKIFRTFKEWDNYIEHHFFADTRSLPGIPKITYKWKSDSANFNRSVAVVFEGNRITRIVDVHLSGEKLIVKYNPGIEEYSIIDYQDNPKGVKTPSTAVVFYFINCEDKDISEEEIIFSITTEE
jgi:hypothetical protein